ncbi:sucrase ferredoxin [Tenggerimyces flavus]|uniref:Sucrase ferredoxin n=1 Tax=Tenggerimyces flavus TaxID=1708749 RepID=A0ABV7YEL5_9ACTN|nr:sucrase ferredoxin [Tenggerimyces flavus]MBM7784265.1 hypothetical protein [Tenggerimyces flavus]
MTSVTACSELSAALGEPLAGTAAAAVTYLCIEQSGPYGREALVESHFDADVGSALAARSSKGGVRIQLIRRPGPHADRHAPGAPRTVLIAHTRPGLTWCERAVISSPADLLALDFAELAAGVAPRFGVLDSSPVLLVCTNGRRDVCCAVRGRPLALELSALHPDAVWESTHTGGHRLAPTAVSLPTGYVYGRLDVAFAESVLAATAKGTMLLDRCRGRSTWSGPGQVAELAVRELLGERDADAVVVSAGPDGALEVSVGSRRWLVSVEQRVLEPPRAVSCGKGAVSQPAYVATSVEEL